jgi:tRNA dimethylallyltransferase
MNSNSPKQDPLIVVLGPTAVGKTELSLRLAERFQGEIISADSRLFYRGMDIGTAKPSPEELARVPHHLVDVADPDQVWNLALYLREVKRILKEIHQRGNLPFLVGGTGQYIEAVVEGWRIPAVKPDKQLRRAIRRWAEVIGVEGLRARLALLDPEAAAGIDGPNLRRMVRALEVIFLSGEKFSDQKGQGPTPYQTLRIGLTRDREELYRRIDQRIHRMMEAGFVEEVQELLDQGYSPELPPLSAIGYRQVIHYLNGVITREEAVRQMKSRTRKYVRKQANWFQLDDPGIRWFDASQQPLDQIEKLIRDFLKEFCYTEK